MNPKPFSLLNHLTVPSGTTPPSTSRTARSGRSEPCLLDKTGAAYRNRPPDECALRRRATAAARDVGRGGSGVSLGLGRRLGRRGGPGRLDAGLRGRRVAASAIDGRAAGRARPRTWCPPPACSASRRRRRSPRRSARAQMPKRRSTTSFGPGWNTMRSSTITTAPIPSPAVIALAATGSATVRDVAVRIASAIAATRRRQDHEVRRSSRRSPGRPTPRTPASDADDVAERCSIGRRSRRSRTSRRRTARPAARGRRRRRSALRVLSLLKSMAASSRGVAAANTFYTRRTRTAMPPSTCCAAASRSSSGPRRRARA